MRWIFPSDKDLRKNDMLDRFDLIFKTPLKWIYLFFILFALFLYWLICHLNVDATLSRKGDTQLHRPNTTR
jgi:hypothetical protein